MGIESDMFWITMIPNLTSIIVSGQLGEGGLEKQQQAFRVLGWQVIGQLVRYLFVREFGDFCAEVRVELTAGAAGKVVLSLY